MMEEMEVIGVDKAREILLDRIGVMDGKLVLEHRMTGPRSTGHVYRTEEVIRKGGAAVVDVVGG